MLLAHKHPLPQTPPPGITDPLYSSWPSPWLSLSQAAIFFVRKEEEQGPRAVSKSPGDRASHSLGAWPEMLPIPLGVLTGDLISFSFHSDGEFQRNSGESGPATGCGVTGSLLGALPFPQRSLKDLTQSGPTTEHRACGVIVVALGGVAMA